MIYFQLPFEKTVYTILPTKGNDCVEIHSFDNEGKITFDGTLETIQFETLEIESKLERDTTSYLGESEEEYIEKLNRLIQDIQTNHLPKVVLSRRKIIEHNGKLDLKSTFQNLCIAYPNAFKYIFQKDGISWAGAFSEVLGEYNLKTKIFKTMSLAGTLPKNEAWTSKEIEEQKPVTQYIENVLKTYTSDIKISETYDHISGAIKHLRTDFEIEIDSNQVDALIQELHPTPAVCGIPKDKCTSLITIYEKYPREYYAGYNQVQVGDVIYYFVNLRCARLFDDRTHLFVGGGITAKSHPQKEWQETELKAQAVLNNLKFLS